MPLRPDEATLGLLGTFALRSTLAGWGALIMLLAASPALALDPRATRPGVDQVSPSARIQTQTDTAPGATPNTPRSLKIPSPAPPASPPAAATPRTLRSGGEPSGGSAQRPSSPAAPVAADSPSGDDGNGGVPLALVLIAATAVLGLTAAAVIVVRHRTTWFRNHGV